MLIFLFFLIINLFCDFTPEELIQSSHKRSEFLSSFFPEKHRVKEKLVLRRALDPYFAIILNDYSSYDEKFQAAQILVSIKKRVDELIIHYSSEEFKKESQRLKEHWESLGKKEELGSMLLNNEVRKVLFETEFFRNFNFEEFYNEAKFTTLHIFPNIVAIYISFFVMHDNKDLKYSDFFRKGLMTDLSSSILYQMKCIINTLDKTEISFTEDFQRIKSMFNDYFSFSNVVSKYIQGDAKMALYILMTPTDAAFL